MRKSICLVLGLVFATCAYSASIKWGSSTPSAAVPSVPELGVWQDCTAFLFAGTELVTMQEAATDVLNQMQTEGWATPVTGPGVDGSVVSTNLDTSGRIVIQTSELDTTFNDGGTYYFYVVIMTEDGKYGIVSSVVEGVMSAEPTPSSPARWNKDQLVGTSGGWVKIAPEPTALALLALGVAGVALRRRIR